MFHARANRNSNLFEIAVCDGPHDIDGSRCRLRIVCVFNGAFVKTGVIRTCIFQDQCPIQLDLNGIVTIVTLSIRENVEMKLKESELEKRVSSL